MVDSDDEEVLYDNGHLGQTLIGEKRYKNLDEVMNGNLKDRRKISKTVSLCIAFVCLGLCLAILGPTLLSLKEHLATTLTKISLVFTGRSLGYLVGAIVGGLIFECFNPLLLIGSTLFMCSMGVIASPYMPTVFLLGMASSTVGLSMGCLDTGANLLCLRLWGEKQSAAMLQALHFSFALGAFVAPLLAAPFLGTTSEAMANYSSTQTTPVITTHMIASTSNPPAAADLM